MRQGGGYNQKAPKHSAKHPDLELEPNGGLFSQVDYQGDETDNLSTTQNERTSIAQSYWSNNWIQEILALFASAILLIALSLFLLKFNDNLAPSFKYNIRLSTIAAIFSTLFRSLIITTIENGEI
jgi:hypothetical protein